jgi:hypothetical protein
MAAPAGNQNAKKGRMFEQALVRAIKQRDLTDGDGETLRKVAEALLEKALAGDLLAVKETRDTLDGKPKQQVDVANADGEAFVTKIVREVVDSPKPQNP